MRLIFLDSKPLGMVANPGNNPDAIRCRQRARDLWAAGVSIFVPEICDYELRRKLIHVGATSTLAPHRVVIGRSRRAVAPALLVRRGPSTPPP